jgi:ComF family protein
MYIPAKRLVSVLKDFISLFFPNYCLGCHNTLVRGESLVCTRCIYEMPKTNYHLQVDNPLRLRLYGRIEIAYALAFFRFTKRGRIQHILHALKYKNEPEVGVVLGKVYGERIKDQNFDFEVILPVPLHPSRQRRRGYNQSFKFAEGLAASLNIPAIEHGLVRQVQTDSQTNKSKLSRWENVNAVFSIPQEELIRGRHVLLVDDVITTGATIEACATLISKAGCRKLSVASIAVA